jgi:homoserine dehydrogenase
MTARQQRSAIRVGLIGLGTIGTGVAKLIQSNQDLIRRRLGCRLELVKIADKDIKRDRGISLPKGVLTTKVQDLIEDPDVDIVVELMGGYDPAKKFILSAFAHRKHVVTANKALLAVHGEEIFDAAERAGCDLGFEGSVGGGIPIIRAVKEGLAANKILSIYGIINGTSNYILTQMTENRRSFKEVLAEAQQKGYAEADPSFDVEGIDSAHKLAILVTLAFGTPVSFKEVYTEGITRITPLDIEYAREMGYQIKLLAIAKLNQKGSQTAEGSGGGGGKHRGVSQYAPTTQHGPPDMMDTTIEARVHPTMIPEDYLIATVRGVYNAIYLVGDAVGETLFYGKGAGAMPTASAVVSDLIEIGRNILTGSSGSVPVAAFQKKDRQPIRLRPMDEIRTLYYLRFMAEDRPGVLSNIAGLLGKHNISISQVLQKGRKQGGNVPVVMMTHQALENDVRSALAEIDDMSYVSGKTVLIRVEATEGE